MIAVDLGQSGCRISIEGKVISTSRGKHAGEPVIEALEANFKELTDKSELVSLSLTGLFGQVGDTKPYLDLCTKYFGAKEVAVIDDGLAGLAGALAGKPGVALTLGGGVVAVGGNGDRLSHSDGLGSHFGDEGGGFWLGSRGLTRALAARDGRDNCIELISVFKDELNSFDNLESKNGTAASTLAISCAKKVLETESSELESIRQEGAKRLADTVISAWKKVGAIDSQFSLTISGGLSRNKSYRSLIHAKILEAGAKVKLMEAAGDNLDGAIWIANNNKHDIKPMLKWARLEQF
jgi:N-acetylglucosamine kinase-like BadF-type ATPase